MTRESSVSQHEALPGAIGPRPSQQRQSAEKTVEHLDLAERCVVVPVSVDDMYNKWHTPCRHVWFWTKRQSGIPDGARRLHTQHATAGDNGARFREQKAGRSEDAASRPSSCASSPRLLRTNDALDATRFGTSAGLLLHKVTLG